MYTCTEDIEENGQIFAYHVGPNGELEQLGEPVNAGGTSTCYLTIDKACKHMLCVNYWNSTLAVIPLDVETGAFTGPIQSLYDPKQGQQMVATAGHAKGGVNHSNNDESTIRMRQADPHSHALVLDPVVGSIAYVPDLGKDLIREFFYNSVSGSIEFEMNVMPSGLCTGLPDGPRYFEFHPYYPIAYVVNELSSTVAVFEVDRSLARELAEASKRGDDEDMSKFQGRSSLRLIQSIKTIPSAFPTTMNTCGRICVHKNGRFVVVSNRRHQSIAIFKVCTKGVQKGELQTVGYFHTRGETPRHFQFDASGQYLLVANQDTDSIAVFHFNLSSGAIQYTGNEYRVPSPNFVCCCPVHDDDEQEQQEQEQQQQEETTHLTNAVRVMTTSRQSSISSSSSSSDSSSCVEATITTAVDSKESLQVELARARQEIALLRAQLLSTSSLGGSAAATAGQPLTMSSETLS